MVGNKFDKVLCLFLILLSFLPFLRGVYPGYYTVASWQISEWLINYQGGFVRRGLPGEIILALSAKGFNPYLLIMGLSFSIWLLLLFVLLKLAVRRHFPTIVIFSQLCMLSPVIGHQIVRKDCLEILLFILSLHFLQKNNLKSVLLANGISGLAVLSHEVYAVISIPMFLITKYTERDEFLSSETRSAWAVCKRFIYAAACISPLLALFTLCILYKGSPSIAHDVWDSWQKYLSQFPISAHFRQADPPHAIDALGWSLARVREGPLSTLKEFSLGIYVPFAWAATTALVAFYLLLLYRSHLIALQVADSKAKDALSNFARILSIQLLAILPLCVVHWDYGRVIFSWAASSIGAFLVLTSSRQIAIGSLVSDATSLLPRTVRHAFGIIRYAHNCALAFAFESSGRLALVKLSLLLFGIPTCCWSVAWSLGYAPLLQPLLPWTRWFPEL